MIFDAMWGAKKSTKLQKFFKQCLFVLFFQIDHEEDFRRAN